MPFNRQLVNAAFLKEHVFSKIKQATNFSRAIHIKHGLLYK